MLKDARLIKFAMLQRTHSNQQFRFGHGKKAWIINHINDEYVKKAQEKNYRSRASFKLLEINEKFKILKDHQMVLDLGSAPGSWSQVIKETNPSCKLAAIDILPMSDLQGVDFYQCDAKSKKLHKQLRLKYGLFDTIVSDMAPNFSGSLFETHQTMVELNKVCLQLSIDLGKPSCNLAMKSLEGQTTKNIFSLLEVFFTNVSRFKPKSSRSQSAQFFLVCSELRKQMIEINGIVQILDKVEISRCKSKKQARLQIQKYLSI